MTKFKYWIKVAPKNIQQSMNIDKKMIKNNA